MKPHDTRGHIHDSSGSFWLMHEEMNFFVTEHGIFPREMEPSDLAEMPFDIFLKRLEDFHISPENLMLRMSDFQ